MEVDGRYTMVSLGCSAGESTNVVEVILWPFLAVVLERGFLKIRLQWTKLKGTLAIPENQDSYIPF